MSRMGSSKTGRRARRQFTEEFRTGAVRLVLDERAAVRRDGLEVVHARIAAVRAEQPPRQGGGIGQEPTLRLRIGRDLHAAHLVGESTVGRMDLDCRRFDRREPPREGRRQRGLQRERRPVMDHDVRKSRDRLLSRGREGLDPQLIDQPRQHVLHERRESDPREPVVERLVRDRDVVLISEGAKQIGERLDVPAAERGHHGQEQSMRGDRAQPFGLPRVAPELIDLVDR